MARGQFAGPAECQLGTSIFSHAFEVYSADPRSSTECAGDSVDRDCIRTLCRDNSRNANTCTPGNFTPLMFAASVQSKLDLDIPERDYTTAPSLKIGRYMPTTMLPTSPPIITMINGSSRLLRASTALLTSDS